MVTDPKEIEIISKARQKNVADPKRSRQHFFSIFEQFFQEIQFDGTTVMDLGPGQWDFGVIAKEKGASRIIGIDKDPAVLSLGEYKGFEAIDGDLKKPWEFSNVGELDGLFCKFSINAFWFANDLVEGERVLRTYLEMLKPNGWGWIAPWNGVSKNLDMSKNQLAEVTDCQRSVFESFGFAVIELSKDQTIRYGVHGSVYNSPLFLRV